jgi:Skp family chaperone for outer membrane proteins
MVATGASAHHAEHVLAALFGELYFHLSQAAAAGRDVEKARAAYYRKIKKITRDAVYRKKLKRQVPADHFGFE